MNMDVIFDTFENSSLPRSGMKTPTYFNLEIASSRIPIGLRILSERNITIKAKSITYQIYRWHAAPTLVALTSTHNPGKDNAEQNYSTLIQYGNWMLDQNDVSGYEEWSKKQMKAAKAVLRKCLEVFSKHSMDLWNTSFVKHEVKSMDPQPFEERYKGVHPACTAKWRAS